jgi:hypothetical protein
MKPFTGGFFAGHFWSNLRNTGKDKTFPFANKKARNHFRAFNKYSLSMSGFRDDGDKRLVSAPFLEQDRAVCQRKQCMIFSEANISARVVFGAALADDNIPCYDLLTAVDLNAKALAFRLAAVLYFTFTFLVCHNSLK